MNYGRIPAKADMRKIRLFGVALLIFGLCGSNAFAEDGSIGSGLSGYSDRRFFTFCFVCCWFVFAQGESGKTRAAAK